MDQLQEVVFATLLLVLVLLFVLRLLCLLLALDLGHHGLDPLGDLRVDRRVVRELGEVSEYVPRGVRYVCHAMDGSPERVKDRHIDPAGQRGFTNTSRGGRVEQAGAADSPPRRLGRGARTLVPDGEPGAQVVQVHPRVARRRIPVRQMLQLVADNEGTRGVERHLDATAQAEQEARVA